MIGVNIPFLVIPAVMLIWLGWSVFTYRLGSRALIRKPVNGLADMTNTKGVVVRDLRPEGLVRIKGELWNARSDDGRIDAGTEVVVVAQEGLKVIVRPAGSTGRALSVEPRKDEHAQADDRQDGAQNL